MYMWKFSKISLSVLLTALFVACGDDSNSDPVKVSEDDSELSNEADSGRSSSSTGSKKKSSSSNAEKGSSARQDALSSDSDEDLDVIYVLVDGTVTGRIALESFAKSAQVDMVLLDSADGYKKTKTTFSGDVGSDGDFEIKKIDLYQPYVLLSVDGKFERVSDGKSQSAKLLALGDATASEVFNLNLLTSLEAERTLHLLEKSGTLYEEAKETARTDVWNMFHLDAHDFDVSELIDVADKSESGAALLAATILLQAGSSDSFEDFYKDVSADVAKDGKWDDEKTRLAIADWALATDLKDGFASIRKSLAKKQKNVAEFEPYIKSFYLAELEFPSCDAETAGDVFFVKNKSSKFYASSYDDVCVIGKYAESPRFQAGGSSHVETNHAPSFLDVINEGREIPVPYEPGYSLEEDVGSEMEAALQFDAMDLATNHDKVILFLGVPEWQEIMLSYIS